MYIRILLSYILLNKKFEIGLGLLRLGYVIVGNYVI